MAKSCCDVPIVCSKKVDKAFNRILWVALALNLAMFFFEFASSFRADSVSLLADAIDFLGDAGNYAISLIVLPLAMHWRSRAALIKGLTMVGYGLFVLGRTGWFVFEGQLPHAPIMGSVGAIALAVNLIVAFLLFSHRNGDANRRSVWLCSRNDAVGNVAVIAAAALVAFTQTKWPDLAVALTMSGLSLTAGYTVIKDSMKELQRPVSEFKDVSDLRENLPS